MTVSLLAVVGGLMLMATRNPTSKANARSLAMHIAEQIRLARMEALTRRVPVAIVFPSDGGSQGDCASLSWLEGEVKPKITRHHNYAKEFPGTRIFIGTWPLAGSRTWKMRTGYPGQKDAVTDLNEWLPDARKQDYCFVFGPDGTVRTNDLPAFDGAYHILVLTGMSAGGTGTTPSGTPKVSPGPRYFELPNTVGQAFTLTLTPGGSLSMETGIVGQSGAIATGDSLRSSGSAAPAIHPPSGSGTNHDPDLIGTISKPEPDEALPPDVNNYIDVSEHVTLETYATDPDGDQMWAFWNVNPPSGRGDGRFSYPPMDGLASKGQMTWDPNYHLPDGRIGAWVSVVQWRPPSDAQPGDRFLLECKVADAPAPPVVAQIKKTVELSPPGKIIFESDREGGTKHLYRMHPNGFFQTRMFKTLPNSYDPSANIDGSRVVFISSGDIWMYTPLADPALVRLTNTGDASLPTINPIGTKIAFKRAGKVFVMDSKPGSTPSQIGAAPDIADDRMTWSPDGDTLLYSNGGSIVSWGAQSVVISGGNPCRAPNWDTDNHIYYLQDDGDPYIWVTGPGGGAGTQYLSSPGYDEIQPCASPVSGEVLLVRRSHGTGAPYQICLNQGGTRVPLTSQGENTDPVWVR